MSFSLMHVFLTYTKKWFIAVFERPTNLTLLFVTTYFGLNLLVPTWLNVQSKWLSGHVEHLIDIELHNDAENDTSTYVHHFLSNLKKWYSDNIHYHVHWLFKLSMRRHLINTWKKYHLIDWERSRMVLKSSIFKKGSDQQI